MQRFFIICFSLLLTTVIVMPSLISLIKNEVESVLTTDIGEEESKKDGKNGTDENEIIAYRSLVFQLQSLDKQAMDFNSYVESKTDFTSEIQLPPPQDIS